MILGTPIEIGVGGGTLLAGLGLFFKLILPLLREVFAAMKSQQGGHNGGDEHGGTCEKHESLIIGFTELRGDMKTAIVLLNEMKEAFGQRIDDVCDRLHDHTDRIRQLENDVLNAEEQAA